MLKKKFDGEHFTLFSGSPIFADFYETWHIRWSRRCNQVYRIFSQLVQGYGALTTQGCLFPVSSHVAQTTVFHNRAILWCIT